MRSRVLILAAALLFSLAVAGYAVWWVTGWELARLVHHVDPPADTTIGSDDDVPPPPEFQPDLTRDDLLDDRVVNQSSAVFELDTPPIRTDEEEDLVNLRPTYLEAMRAVPDDAEMLPGVCVFAGAARQFDDGAAATLELAAFNGELGIAPSAPVLLEAIFERLGPNSSARPFLAAALELAGRAVELRPTHYEEKGRLLSDFEADVARYKTVGFYAWGPQLERVRRFSRFLQYPFTAGGLAVPRDIAAVLGSDPELLRQYRALYGFYGALGNPRTSLPVDALLSDEDNPGVLARRYGVSRPVVSILPPSNNAFRMLYQELIGGEVAPSVDIVGEMSRRLLRFKPDLAPSGDLRGWYQYRVGALEARLLPIHGPERDKLALTARFKSRLVGFQRTEIEHYRTLRRRGHTEEVERLPEDALPRLRVAPFPVYYLRTARGYAWIEEYLTSTVGAEQLRRLHGTTPQGIRPLDLATEFDEMRQRFYGLFLISCADLGMDPTAMLPEMVDREACVDTALRYLANLADDPDLACDARVAWPIFEQERRRRVAFVGLFGIRLSKLAVRYTVPPQVRPADDPDADWRNVSPALLVERVYLVPTDDYGEFELRQHDVLSRREFRAICDDHRTHADIRHAFMQREYME